MEGAAVASVAMGAYGMYQANEQSKQAQDAANRSLALQKEDLAFRKSSAMENRRLSALQMEEARAQQSAYEELFGDMRDNLVNYYNELDPSTFQAQYNSSIEANMKGVLDSLDKHYAQLGLDTSGLAAGATANTVANSAAQRTAAGFQAKQDVVNKKTQLLAASNAMMNPYDNNVLNTYSAAINANSTGTQSVGQGYNNLAGGYLNKSNLLLDSAAGYGQGAGSLLFKGLESDVWDNMFSTDTTNGGKG